MKRIIFASSWTVFAIAAILLAVVLTISRVLLPMAGDYREEIEQWISGSLGQPVHIGMLAAEWQGFGPRLNMKDITLLDDKKEKILVRLNEVKVGLDLMASLLNGRVELGNLVISGARLSVLRNDDGSIRVQGFAEKQQQDTPREESIRLLQWLFARKNIAIEESEMVWLDSDSDRSLRFSDVNLDLRNDGSRHQFDGSATLPLSVGRRIAFAIDLKGDALMPGGWSATGYVNGGGLHIAELLEGRSIAGIQVDDGVAELRLWSEWKNSRLVKLEGMLTSFGMKFSPIKGADADKNVATHPPGINDLERQPLSGEIPAPYLVDTLSGRFVWQQHENGWAMVINNFIMGRHSKFWPFSNINIQVSNQTGTPLIEAKTSYLRVADIRDLFLTSDLPDPGLRRTLVAMEPAGDLYDAYVAFQGSDNHPEKINIVSRFESLSLEPWGKIPGVKGISGTVKGDQTSGSIKLSTSPAQIEFESMFREPLAINELNGVIAWQHHDGEWRLISDDLFLRNDDLEIRARMGIEVPDDGRSPYLALDVNFTGEPGSGAHKSRYLPVSLIPNTVKWLDKSIVGGTVSDGTFVFNGRIDQFPFRHEEGKFDIRFRVTDGILDYAEGWPRLEEIETEVHFFGSAMEINAVAGKSLDSEIIQLQAKIANLGERPAVLELHGTAQGPTQDALRHISESPLAEKFGQYLKDVAATGRSKLVLELIKPLAAAEPAQVKGVLTFDDSSLLLADSHVDITNIKGDLEFTDSTLTANNINARLLGLESVIDVKTQQEQQLPVIHITANGSADEQSIRQLLDSALLENIAGQARWSASLRIPKTAGDKASVSSLHIESDLKGMAINLPQPFRKEAAESRKLVIDTGLPRRLDKVVTLRFGKIISANLDLDAGMHIEKGEIHIGEGKAPSPQRDGLHVSGSWPALSLGEWIPLMKAEKIPGKPPSVPTLKDIDINIDSVEAFGSHYHKVKLQAARVPDMWQVTVNSDELKGTVQLPSDSQAPLIMDLDYLHLTRIKDDKTGDDTDPRNIPIVRITSKDFTYHGMDFGALSLIASRHPDGIHIDSLKLASSTMNIDAQGDWVVVNDKHYSSFSILFNSHDLGHALSNWGYAGSIKNGLSTFNIVARWPGSPASFALEQLDGSLKLNISDGRLLDIDPGAGRIFGLISLQALPRRLSLDFSDIFEKGFSFDRIAGDFILKDGDATTNKLLMEGPAARIEAQGRIGLGARDYDQVVTVIPHVTSSLPVAGAVVGGVGVGAAILLAQKLLESGIDKATQVKYNVTGPWDNPVVKRIPEKEKGVDEMKDQKQEITPVEDGP